MRLVYVKLWSRVKTFEMMKLQVSRENLAAWIVEEVALCYLRSYGETES